MPTSRLLLLALVVFLPGRATAQESPKLPRVLIIGDSISLGYTEGVRKNLAGIAEVSRPKTNCQHTAFGLQNIDTWLGTGKWDVIHFNWGIWDTHMLDDKGGLIRNESQFPGAMRIRHTPEQYRKNLTRLVDRMAATGATLVWASTTPVMSRTGKRFEDVKTLNTVAADLMKERKIATDDLYEFTLPHVKEWHTGDKVHFNAKGNENLAKQVSQSIQAALKARSTGK